ncbi:MAG: hypothetical protein Rhims3KO_04100 [Hyphomicrobiales bacterium]
MLNHILSKLKILPPRPSAKKKLMAHPRHRVSDPWYSVDPLSHPDIQNMDQTQLGDLNFDPRCFRDRP